MSKIIDCLKNHQDNCQKIKKIYKKINRYKDGLQCEAGTILGLKFGLSEKHTKIKKNLPHGFDKSADLLSKRQKHEEDFFQIMCASQKVRTLIL